MFKRIREKFLIFFFFTLVVAFWLCFLFISGFNAVVIFLSGVFFAVLIAFDIKIYKGFSEESFRYDFRIRSLVDRFIKQEIILTVDEIEIQNTIAEAYKKYGIKKRWIIYFFVILAVLIAAGLSISL